MDAQELFEMLIEGLILAGVPVDEETFVNDAAHQRISIYWYGGASHFWTKMTRPDMLNHIKSSIQNHLKFHLKRIEKEAKVA